MTYKSSLHATLVKITISLIAKACIISDKI